MLKINGKLASREDFHRLILELQEVAAELAADRKEDEVNAD